MSDQSGSNTGSGNADVVKLIYLLNFAGFINGLTTVIGVIIAYVRRGDADDIAETHLTYQIRTFWISILYVAISFLLMFVLIGFVTLFAWLIWAIVRNVKGFLLMNDGKPIPDPETWLW